jgi:hypothetical protein
MKLVLRSALIAATVVSMTFGVAACKKADNSSTDTSAAASSDSAMSGPAATNGAMGASGVATPGAASGASQ